MSERKNDPAVGQFLTLDALQNSQDILFDTVSTPEWGADTRIGSLPAEDMMVWAETREGPAKRTAGLRLLAKSLVDGNGERLAKTDSDVMKWVNVFLKKNSGTCTRCIRAIAKLNGFNEEDQKQVKNDSSEVSTDASPTVLH